MSQRRANPRDPGEVYWLLACCHCQHPGGLHVIDDGCRFCQCPGWEEGGMRYWSDRQTYDLAGTRAWHEQPVAPFDQRHPLPEGTQS